MARSSPMRLGERELQVVLPAPGGLHDLRLDRRGVHRGSSRGSVRTSMWMRASTASVSCTVYSTLVPESRRLRISWILTAHVGVEVLARQVDEAGEEAPVEVAAQEEARAPPVAQPQHARGDLEERRLVDLEELVARVGVQHRAQVLVAVARRGEAGRGRGCAPPCAAAAGCRPDRRGRPRWCRGPRSAARRSRARRRRTSSRRRSRGSPGGAPWPASWPS